MAASNGSSVSRFKIGDKIYSTVAVNDLSLAMLLELEDALAGIGRALTITDVRRIGREIEALPPAERGDHPQFLLMTAIGVWAARRTAGEQITFVEALETRVTDLRALPNTTDRRAPANPTRARTASARAGKLPAPRKSAALNSKASASR